MRASNRETIYSAGSGDWTQDRLITVSGSARTVPMSHRDKPNLLSYLRSTGFWWTATQCHMICVTRCAVVIFLGWRSGRHF